MFLRSFRSLAIVALCWSLVAKPPARLGCGTTPTLAAEEAYLHSRAERNRPAGRLKRLSSARATNQDNGNIAIIDDSDGVIARRNPFNLDLSTIVFAPSIANASKYRLQNGDPYDRPASNNGAVLAGIGDDDAREIPLPFTFPFYGRTYASVWINSNGNLTFEKGDGESVEQSLGRLVGGSPRIAALFRDLDPSAVRQGAIRVLNEPARFVVSFDRVPEYSDFGTGLEQTFQIRLYPSGRIEIAYNGISSVEAVVGISPGHKIGSLSLLPFSAGSASEFSGTVAEVFTGVDEVDVASAAQKFYATHDDAYDYLMFYNASGVNAKPTAVAYEVTVRNSHSGYAVSAVDIGADYGSPSRLQAVINMGPLSEYPLNPNSIVALRIPSRDTPLTILGHESGHLFLAFTSVPAPNDPQALPMLGQANAHWAFTFNSDASLLEGNRIRDDGAGVSPRFTTTKTVEGYSALDQYLMGFLPPTDVQPMFYVSDSPYPQARIPQPGISFNGTRHDVKIEELIAVEGRRTPDSTVAQRRFRFGFVLILPAGISAPADQVAQVESYRVGFEDFFAKASGNHAIADTTVKRAVHFTGWPAAGVVVGSPGSATLTLESPAPAATSFVLDRLNGFIDAPSTVTIPAGASSASFAVTGLRSGVEELTIRPSDPRYETVSSRIHVRPSPDGLTLSAAGLNLFRVSDVNELPYSGVRIRSAGLSAVTGTGGQALLDLPLASTVTVSIEGSSSPGLVVQTSARPVISASTNAASFATGITPGAFATLFGSALGGTTQVLVAGVAVPVSFVNTSQVNFLVPARITGPTAAIVAAQSTASSAEFRAPVLNVSPGIFAVINQGTALEIYATGLNGAEPTVTVGGIDAKVRFSGQPQFPGLDQVNVLVPAGVPPGAQPVVITAGGVRSNAYRLQF